MRIVLYDWMFQSMDKGNFGNEKDAIPKVYYELVLKDSEGQSKSYQLSIRDLIVSTYIDIFINEDDANHSTVSAIFNKTNRWLKLKTTLPLKCMRDTDWERKNNIDNFDTLLQHIVEQIDQRIKLDCAE